ncbi:uncharacterized protein LOC110017918 [Phalaenopsis equestris]|uniref:uncharacterized protein LOC110017918 n=1 Tax=Phalaenopsis equestris TaxID=78828 RepID=UPI0009E32B5F|nr:uncharacterized protein LOC110017918 [Phalaenopsis equestris]
MLVSTISTVSAPPSMGGNSAICIGSDGSLAPPVVAIHGLNEAVSELVKKRGRPKYIPLMAPWLPSFPDLRKSTWHRRLLSTFNGQSNIDLLVQGDPMKKAKRRPLGSRKK